MNHSWQFILCALSSKLPIILTTKWKLFSIDPELTDYIMSLTNG